MSARLVLLGVAVVAVVAALSGTTITQLDGGDATQAQYHTDAASLPASDYVIDLSDGFPDNLTITAGQSVLWVNNDDEVHTVTKRRGDNAGPGPFFDSGPLAPGEFYLRTFDDEGEIRYHSTTDEGEPDEQDWTGKITVQPAD